MELCVIAVFLHVPIVRTFAAETTTDFFNNFEEVPPPPPESYEVTPKCGEGEQKGRFMCVPYYNCDPDTNTVVLDPIADGSGSINPRAGADPQCWHYLQVCCRIPIHNETSPVPLPPTINVGYKLKCGVDQTKSGDFPWLVTIFNSKKPSVAICEGSIISPVAILTAAHCVGNLKSEEIVVRTGRWTKQNYMVFRQEKKVSRVFINDHYLQSTLYSDVALLILNSSLSNENIGTVCLPSDDNAFDSSKCALTKSNKAVASKKVVSLRPHQICQGLLRRKLGDGFLLDHSFTCANDNCYIKGGSPLVCSDSSNNNRYFQVGIASWNAGCDNTLPGVYVNVTLFRHWIDYKLRELGYDYSYYTF